MDGLTILAVFLILWGSATLLVALLKPPRLWQMGKIQGFVQVLSETGAVILFVVVAVAAIVGGVLLLF